MDNTVMKHIYRLFLIASAVLAAGSVTSCVQDEFEDVSEVNLIRCLTPMNLSSKVVQSLGDVVTFSWDVTKDAESYTLEIYSDQEMTNLVSAEAIQPSDLPLTINLTADSEYWWRVQATNQSKQPSKWAVSESKIKTFAVKDPLYLKVGERAADSMTLTWSTEIEDCSQVTHIEYGIIGAAEDALSRHDLTPDEISAGRATVTGLGASTQYVFTLYYMSASRGELNAWTMPDMNGLTEVSTSAALEQAIKDGASILLKMSGSPYTIAGGTDPGLDVSKGCKIVGESSADGTRPVINGAISINADFTGGFNFEGVDFNGNNNAVGHPICLKNGGAGSLVPVDFIIYKNCALHGYSKGLIYEWNQTFKLGELTYDSCDIYAINEDGSGGGDVIDFRGKSECETLNLVNCTIYNGMRTFIRIDAGTWGKINVTNNTMRNLCLSDNSNNAGIIAINKDNGTSVGEFNLKNNLFLDMPEKSILGSGNAKYYASDAMSVSAQNNWYWNCAPDTFFTTNFPASLCSALSADPCYNAKAGIFNLLASSEIADAGVGAPKWWTAFVKEPEDLTLNALEGPKTWDFTNAKFFSGTSKEPMVRDQLMITGAEEFPISFSGTSIDFPDATACNKKGVPTYGYLCFKVTGPGSVVVKPVKAEGCETAHIIVATGSPSVSSISVKGGAAPIENSSVPTKIVIGDIAEETMVYVYASGAISLAELAWSSDLTAVNTALAAPAGVKVAPASLTAGEATDIVVTWDEVESADSYSVMFSGKTYDAEKDEATGAWSYTIPGKTTGMLDAGSYNVSVFANPGKEDIYNTMSEAGVASFAVLPKGGSEEDSEFIVATADEFKSAIEAGKTDITVKYSDTPMEIGAVTVTAPLRVKGQTSGDKKTPVKASFTLSGSAVGSFVLNGLEICGDSGTSVIIDDKTADAAPSADTVAVLNCYIHGTKALYDNSGKAVSDIQNVIIKGNIFDNCSDGADWIDFRAGAHHNFVFVNNTVANSCRTVFRTDAGHEMNYATIANNTFYKVATNSSSKDNNGIFHIRSAAGAGLVDYKVISNLFYSIPIDTEPSNAAGFPKFRSKGGLTPNTIVNNYFYNCEEREDKAAYSFWSYLDKSYCLAGGGAILPADPCKDAANGDFTLINGVAMNAGVGDPRWNPSRGSKATSEITVNNVDELLTAISAGKKVITLADGTYDLTAVADVPEVASGKLTVSAPLTLQGGRNAIVKGGFQFAAGADSFVASGFTLDGAATVDNAFYNMDGSKMGKFALTNMAVTNFKNRLIYQDKETSSIESAVLSRTTVTGGEGAEFTSGDFIDFRKGGLNALKVTNCTFANCIRTFARIDAAVVCSSIVVENNTFWHCCYVDSKDNNGIMHVRSSSVTGAGQVSVRNNIFAGMTRAAETPGNTAGFPKLVSTASATIAVPNISHNYYYDINAEGSYSWWNTITAEQGTAGYGVVLSESPFKDAAAGDFTLTSALAASEKVGDQRWNTARPSRPDGFFEVADVEGLLTAIDAGKKEILLTGKVYDFSANATLAGKLSLTSGILIKGQNSCGVKPQIIGTFDLAAVGEGFELNNVSLTGAYASGDKTEYYGDMIVINAAADLTKLALVGCDVTAFKNRLISGPNESKCGPVIVKNCTVSGIAGADFTSGDFIDFRKGSVASIKATGNTFSNGIRTFVRVDAAVVCGAVAVENNTFFNCGAAVSKDNNGILHVRSTSATANPRQITCRKNIFAGAKPDAAALADAADNVKTAGFPHLISKTSATIATPVIADNLFFDLQTDGDYSFWTYMPEGTVEKAGQVLTETPFTGDTATGNFTVSSSWKGYGDLRW